ncbi:2-oxoglutarate (2OG) and Fe(II)-dependent oxygenase superfamily protein isoform 1 [Theobroma cacao]|uniref:2-oxoglutarate (2OG) and Fe(II)-dependent oxygenase superfamily protein isoform 1 n=1 Tax=Theobroma cacao TaxID=3641 RepID=A0A061GZ50_THECC|nr:2-oxoglutarate (2OG) and Fe(II)-dependent oxygenase superfamily protein isoform 1 [Theobroma cacao]
MSAASTVTTISTPTLDSESPALLQSITSHGGYAYAGMATLAAAGDQRAAEAAREMAWEQLHSGPWHSVLPVWRDAYSMACLHMAKFHFSNGEFRDALRALDMGIIMGGPLLRKDLDSAIEAVSAAKARRDHNGGADADNEDPEKARCRLLVCPEQLDKSELLRILPIRSLSSKIVGRRSALSLEGFLREYFLSGSPVIITDCMTHWAARTRWNDMDYLRRVAGDRTVPVEVGKNYLCSEWKQELITFSQFLERVQSNGCRSKVPTYLAQHQLFDQINELRKDISIPDYCYAGGGELRSLNAWFGPAGTVTPLHHDPHHNVLAQVVGKKYVRLYSASYSEELYPYSETMLNNSSQVDLDNMDDVEFPKVRDLEFLDCILEEGEMLYIPPKWWHYVRSLTTSFSVSFWWSDSGSSAVS